MNNLPLTTEKDKKNILSPFAENSVHRTKIFITNSWVRIDFSVSFKVCLSKIKLWHISPVTFEQLEMIKHVTICYRIIIGKSVVTMNFKISQLAQRLVHNGKKLCFVGNVFYRNKSPQFLMNSKMGIMA